jgi:amidase
MSENTTGIGSQERAIIRQLEELSENGVVKLMTEHRLDAIPAPDSDATPLVAYIGLPGIVLPAGYDEQGVPFSICYSGLRGYDL